MNYVCYKKLNKRTINVTKNEKKRLTPFAQIVDGYPLAS